MKQLVYIAGSGHSGSTLLDRLLGSQPNISALGEIHRYSLGLNRFETPFSCDCGLALKDCAFWREVTESLQNKTGLSADVFKTVFKTTDHTTLQQQSGEKYFNAQQSYRFIPARADKYLLSMVPTKIAPIADKLNLLGQNLQYARNSHMVFDAVREITDKEVIIDSTKNSLRMRALYLTSNVPMKIIFLKRDGRAVVNSRMKRQNISVSKATRIWLQENKKVEFVLRRMSGVPVYRANYEDLCRDSDAEIGKILEFIGEPVNVPKLGLERHAIGGNPSRLDGKLTVTLDESWKKNLSETDINEYIRIVGHKNV